MYNPSGDKKGWEPTWKKSVETQKEDSALRKIADKNFEKKVSIQRKPRPDLIDNFHWVIMRVRRSKKITQEQFAREISEPLAAIKMAEEGILPERDYTLIKKIENYLGVVLIKEELPKPEQRMPTPQKSLNFDLHSSRNLTIADLRRIKEENKNKQSFSEFEVDFDEESVIDEEDDR